MIPRRVTRSGRLLTDRRGATAVETALVLIPFVMFIVGIIEIGYQYTTASLLDAGALRTSRFGATGQGATNPQGNVVCRSQVGNTTNALRARIVSGSGNFLVGSRLQISVTNFPGVSTTLTAASNVNIIGANSFGAGGTIVRYSLSYPQPFLTAAWTRLFGGSGSITHTANVIIKNEPFSATC